MMEVTHFGTVNMWIHNDDCKCGCCCCCACGAGDAVVLAVEVAPTTATHVGSKKAVDPFRE